MPTGSYIVLDLETTGLDPAIEGIVEVAAVRLEGGVEVAGYEQLVRPAAPITPASAAIHGISAEMVESAPPIEAVLPEFLAFIGESPLVAHNAPFDMAFLNRALQLSGRSPLTNPVIDTLELAREVFPRSRSLKLEALCRLLGHEGARFHRALDDAKHLAAVFPALLHRYRQKQAWYEAQASVIDDIAERHFRLGRMIDDMQTELAETYRVLAHYLRAHPDAQLPLPDGSALVWQEKENWDYDMARLLPLLEAYGLKERMLKLDRGRLERHLGGERITPEQRQAIAETRTRLGSAHRVTRQAPPPP